jgi:hypothetical protein
MTSHMLRLCAPSFHTGWDEALPVCSWHGVTCSDEGLVQEISLACSVVGGTRPGQLASGLVTCECLLHVWWHCSGRARLVSPGYT